MLAQGGTSPGSPLFELMNGDSATAYSTWRDSINAARSLHETSNAAIAGMPVNPQQVAAAEIVADPMNLVPMVGMGGKGGAMAAKAVGAAGQLAERAGQAAVRVATYPERMLAGAAEKLAGVPASVAERTAQDLATKAAVVDVATGFIPGATEIAATKAAGHGVAAAGEAVAAAAGEAVGGAGMLSSVEKAAANPALSTGARAILNVTARLIPRDAAVVAAQAAEGALVGGVIGGTLGGLQSVDEEEIGQAIGGGIAAGTMIGGGLKLMDVATGKVAKERVFNDAARNIEKAQAAGETPADIGFRADLYDRLGKMDRKGEALGTFLAMDDLISQRGGKVKVVDGDIVKGPGGETGWNAYFDPKDKTIYINSKSADATTLPHEAVHSFVADRLADDITARIFTRDADGRLQQTVPGGEIAKLIEGYLKDADNVDLGDGTTEGQRLRERLDAAFDPATPTSEQVSRLRDITHEITARYAEDWVKKKGPRDFLPGTIPTIWGEAISAVRGKLDQTFGRNTGNPILDPVLKRIFDPKETGVPERTSIPLDPRALSYDWSDKKGMFMTRYTAKSEARGEQHWREVTKVVEPILKAAGGETPESNKYSKNNISLRNVGEDVINSLTTRNIETDLRSSAPIMGAKEAEMTNTLIRAMKTGELVDLRDYMAFLNEGKAESGVARQGTPQDKRVAVIDVFWNKDNGVQALTLDIASAMSRLAKAVKAKGDASGFTSVAEAQSALSQYLRHVADSETNFDAAKKGWEIEIGGRPMGKTAHKTLHEALGVPDSGKSGLPPFRPDIAIGREGINRISGIEFVLPRRVTGQAVQTGVITPISNKGVDAVQRRFQPNRTAVENLPNGMVAQDADGARIVKTDTSGYRLFDPLGERIGIYRTLEQAAEAATRQAENDLATVKEVQYAIQEQRAKEISVRQRASNREAVRQGDTQRQEAARTRFQPQKEEAYLKAVERGDTETAQRMVDEAAKAAGYEASTFIHETTSEKPFNEFKVGGPKIRAGQRLALGDIFSGEKLSGHAIWFRPEAGQSLTAHREGRKQNIKAKLKLTMPLMGSRSDIDAYGGFNRHFPQVVQPSDVKRLRDLGRDSVVYTDEKTGNVIEVLVFDPNQIKSAEPITRDNQGNVIPLSQRFDISSPDIRFQPKRREEKLPKTPFAMGQQIQAQARAAKQADVAQVRSRILGEGAGSSVERAVAQEAMAREAELFARPKKIAISDEQLTAIRDAGIMETYVRALLNFEDAYTKMTGQAPVGKGYQSQAMKMTKRQQDAILRLAMSNDTPQARLAIEAAREAADPAMRTAIERMLEAEGRRDQRQPTQQQQSMEGVRRSLQTVLPQDFGVPSMREIQGLRRGVREATEGALQDVRAKGEAEAAQIAAEREAKLAQVEESAAQAAVELSEEMARKFSKLKTQIAKAEEVVTAEQADINPSRIILKLNGKYRLYGATAGLIGVFRNREDAIKKAKK